MDVTFRKSTLKVLRRMQPAKRDDVLRAIDSFSANPDAPNNNVATLKGVPGGVRIRVGDWRVSMAVDTEAERIDVFEIAPRGSAYRW